MTRPLGIASLVLAIWVFASPVARAQSDPAPPAAQPAPPAEANAPDLTPEQIRREIEALEADESVDPGAKASALQLYEQAIAALESAAAWEAKAAEFDRLITEATALRDAIRAELAQSPAEPAIGLPADAGVAQIERALDQARAELDAARTRLGEIAAERIERERKRSVLPDRITAARNRLSDLADDLATIAPETTPALANAQRTLILARQREARANIRAIERELANIQLRTDLQLLDLRRDRAARRLAQAETLTSKLQSFLTEQRLREADRAAREARRLARDAAAQAPQIQEIAADNQSLASRRAGEDGLANRLEEASRRSREVREDRRDLSRRFERMRQKIEIAGLTEAMGKLLRREYQSLPDETRLRRRMRSLLDTLAEVQIRQIELEEQREELSDVEGAVQRTIDDLPATLPAGERAEAQSLVRELMTQRRALLNALIDENGRYIDTLQTLSVNSARFLEETRAYRSYIEERILWVRSATIDPVRVPAATAEAALWLFASPAWVETIKIAGRAQLEHFLLTGLFIIGALLLFLLRRRWRKYLHALRRLAGSPESVSYWQTLAAAALTPAIAAPLPAVLLFIGWRLSAPEGQTTLGVAAGVGLMAAAGMYFFLETIRQIVRPGGLADAHFRWSAAALACFRRHLRWLILAALPLIFIIRAMDTQPVADRVDSLGRLAFVSLMVLLAIFTYRVGHPQAPVMQEFLKRHRDGAIDRTHRLWFPLLVAIPLLLSGITLLGYYYTALALSRRVVESLVFIAALVLLNALLLRWLHLARRGLAIDRWTKRRDDAEAAPAADAITPPVAAESTVSPAENVLDLPAIDAQTRKLFRSGIIVTTAVGLFLIWANVLPALRVFDRVQVWPEFRVLESVRAVETAAPDQAAPLEPIDDPAESVDAAETPGATGQTRRSAVPIPLGAPTTTEDGEALPGSLTLADLGVSLLLAIITIAAARNIPGLLEIALLQRLPLEPSIRFAITTVARYLIVIIGITATFGALGIGWSKVQWLAAALTFGLAFGMQEIFANFVSGLIILAERPMRVGDTVTIGNVSGTVSQIRMRATTITDWDRKELIVPNKSFITDQLINWTLSDPTLRQTIPVGVAYGSDIDKVQSILLEVAARNENALTDPAAQALFLGFGDSSLNFELRVFIGSIDNFIRIRSELHFAIDKAFRREGIEISFPQRDLHIRSAPALDALVKENLSLQADDSDSGAER